MPNHIDDETHPEEEAFDLDGMLGRLAKWLRILGFDAAYPCKRPSEDRYFVTANKKVRDPRAIIVKGNDPVEQLREVLGAAQAIPRPGLFLSRCLICNIPVREVPRIRVLGRVAPQIHEAIHLFNECPCCGRVYWEGSHSTRIKLMLEKRGIIGTH
ncbi:MAG: hypothetical protein HY912_22505 [Desulfomonile tiedjei]|uniref:Mut7-C RNAse domain-containing protein n=1 Tax=Desulfomonile tiedjei TaxID=2358 RepID=A0A9D6V551_9BACT|nr:hypothetical protein [Desulfomonile tiedjei]